MSHSMKVGVETRRKRGEGRRAVDLAVVRLCVNYTAHVNLLPADRSADVKLRRVYLHRLAC